MIDAEGLFRDSLGDNYDEAKATISYNTAISAIKAYVNKDLVINENIINCYGKAFAQNHSHIRPKRALKVP